MSETDVQGHRGKFPDSSTAVDIRQVSVCSIQVDDRECSFILFKKRHDRNSIVTPRTHTECQFYGENGTQRDHFHRIFAQIRVRALRR